MPIPSEVILGTPASHDISRYTMPSRFLVYLYCSCSCLCEAYWFSQGLLCTCCAARWC